ncbi:MAG: hypothetical protein GXO85_00990 [Chlorobi bacterium]|nr:hypothetical protein [Chlorobiota bacterium]
MRKKKNIIVKYKVNSRSERWEYFNALWGIEKSRGQVQRIKELPQVVGRTSLRGGKNNKKQVKQVIKQYLTKATALNEKLSKAKGNLPIVELTNFNSNHFGFGKIYNVYL